MITSNLVGVALALGSAIAWGSGDFSGGLATRRNDQFQVLALAALSGVGILLVFAGVMGERLPEIGDSLWALAAGAAGALGIASLYRGLAIGQAAFVAPTAAVIGAVVPVIFGILTEGVPGATQLIGFSAALVGIWLVTRSAAGSVKGWRPATAPAVLAGVFFGGFFILIAQVEGGLVFAPLIIARGAALTVALLFTWMRGVQLPAMRGNPTALVAGILDAGGNVFYLLANQYTRLDVAAVLASLYPATTVILSNTMLHQEVSRRQWLGVVICLGAVTLIAV